MLGAGGRYEMHELLRQYAAEKLERQPEMGQAVRDRHSAFYSAALSQWGIDLQGARQRVAEAEIEADLDNVRAAWAWAAQRGQAESLGRAIDGFCLFCIRQRRYQEAATACERAVDALERTSTGDLASSAPGAVERLKARALAWQGHFCEQMGDIEAAARLNERSRALLQGLDPEAIHYRQEWALALFAQAQYTWQTDLEQTRRLLARSLALYRALDDRWWMSAVLMGLGGAENQLGRHRQAERLFRESLAIDRSLGDRWGAAEALTLLADKALEQGRLEEGERLVREALAGIEGTRGWGGDIRLDAIRCFSGKFAEARSAFERDVALYDDLGFHKRLVEATEKLIWCDVHLGRYEEAQALAQANLARCREIGYQHRAGWALMQAGVIALALGEPVKARRQLAEGVGIFRSMAEGVGLAQTLAFLAYADRALGRPIEAERHMCEAVQMAIEGPIWHLLTVCLPGVALLLADRGNVERAIEVYSLALCQPELANSRWVEDVAGKHIAAAAAALPSEVVAAAQERGRALDLWATARALLDELGGAER
jgi:tetratricopeptide (TPR) repeat protein